MADQPPPTQWGQMIRARREALGLSIGAAAKQAGLSKANWGNIERGYQNMGLKKTFQIGAIVMIVNLLVDQFPSAAFGALIPP